MGKMNEHDGALEEPRRVHAWVESRPLGVNEERSAEQSCRPAKVVACVPGEHGTEPLEGQARMEVRESSVRDPAHIREVHRAAFGPTEGSVVSQLALDLLSDETARPVLSLIAVEDGEIVGGVIFSRIVIEGHAELPAHILAPLAVAKAHQGRGVGSALISRGLKLLEERGSELVMVLCDPRYYSRAGFHTARDLEPPYPLDYPEAWMVQELREGTLERVTGAVRCATSLSAPEHW